MELYWIHARDASGAEKKYLVRGADVEGAISSWRAGFYLAHGGEEFPTVFAAVPVFYISTEMRK